MKEIRTGDTVYHHPTKENWLVAWVEGERLFWAGYPFGGWVEGERLFWAGYPFGGFAQLDDCELIRSCTDEYHMKMIKQIGSTKGNELPVIRCREILSRETENF